VELDLMASQLLTQSIAAPGFYGLNLQESSITLSSGFALKAQNCVIDKYGRIGARRGWTPVNTTVNTDLGSGNPVEFIFEVVTGGGTDVLSAGNNKLFVGTTTMTTKTVRNTTNSGDATYTITANDWQGAALSYGDVSDFQPHVYMAQAAHPMLVYHELPVSGNPFNSHDSGTFGYQRVGDAAALPSNHTTSTFMPSWVLSAYGRIWCGGISGDTQTVYFSDLLAGTDFQNGSAGYLNLQEVLPNGDPVVAAAAHNGYIIFFGKKNTAIYANPLDTGALTLVEVLNNVGCIARDSVQSLGTDVIFLSDAGVRSLQRVIQEKSLPMRDISKNVRDELMSAVASETDLTKIKSIYFERDAIYLLTLPTTKFVYCFDTRAALQDNSMRVTIWDSLEPKAFCVTQDRNLLIGKPGYIGKYFGYSDNTSSYRLQYYTNYFDFDAATALKVLKKIGWILIGGTNQSVAIKWGFDYSEGYQATTYLLDTAVVYEYNNSTVDTIPGSSEYNIAEYTSGIVLDRFSVNAGGQGTVMQLGLEADINGNPLSIQKIDVGIKKGKTLI
jgi:hypothetical protein